MDQLISLGFAIVGAGVAQEVGLGGIDIKEAAVVGVGAMAGTILGGGIFGEWFSDNPYYDNQYRGFKGEFGNIKNLGEGIAAAAVGGLVGSIAGMLIMHTPSKNIMYNTLGAGGGLALSLFIGKPSAASS